MQVIGWEDSAEMFFERGFPALISEGTILNRAFAVCGNDPELLKPASSNKKSTERFTG
jgi:hypothetical protein